MTLRRIPTIRGLVLAAACAAACAVIPSRGGPRGRTDLPGTPRPGSVTLADQLSTFVREQMREKALPAVCVALVDSNGPLWEAGFGFADPDAKKAATPHTIIRAGSISKLFTDIALLQLVEKEQIDLDDPVTRFVPGFAPGNPFGGEITLRQLMCHRSGLCREPPVGNYFDTNNPSLAATVESLNRTALVHAPGAITKYSNAGIGVVGRALELADGRAFAESVSARVLAPLELADSSFELTSAVRANLARGEMWTLEGRAFEAPALMMGAAPAGNLFSSVHDLGRFATVMLRRGESPAGRLLAPETLEGMWIPQFDDPNKDGFGLGFAVSKLDGRRRVGHGGAIYGFATELAILPDDDLAVAVAITVDCANSVARRIADAALEYGLAARGGAPYPKIPRTRPLDPQRARALAGRYEAEGESLVLCERGGRLFLEGSVRRVELRALDGAPAGALVVDDRIAFGRVFEPVAEGLKVGNQTFRRAADPLPPPPRESWLPLLGEYGWDHNTLFVLEKDGVLHALIEWFESYPLREESPDHFRFPDAGLYSGETLVFERDAAGRVTGLTAANVAFPRRPGAESGAGRIRPVSPVAELAAAAKLASPPIEEDPKKDPDLVEVRGLDPTIQLDIRYATHNNFLGEPLYPEPRAFLQRDAAESLVDAHHALQRQGYGIRIHDGYRPWWVTKVFWEATPEAQKIFVADPNHGSRHNRGCAADITLYDLATGDPVEMTGEYDEGSPRSYPAYPGGTSRQRWYRELLRRALESNGFEVYPFEWWHFDYHDWRDYPILNVPFDRIRPAK